MVNVPSLFDIILTCFRYISGCPWPYSASGKGTKSTGNGAYRVATNIGSICVKDTYIGSTSGVDT